MANGSSQIVQKLWNYCNVLRDDGMSYGDYVEQLTYLLFLKMADERSKPPYNQPSPIPKKFDWQSLLKKDGDDLFDHYRHLLDELGKEKGLLGLIFGRAQNKFQDPAKLRRLVVDLIDKEDWSSMSADVKGDAYEGLLEKNAQDTKSGAGQYFTPRPLISAIVDVMAPKPKETICDPACGTGGFLLATHDYIAKHYKLNKDETNKEFTLKTNTLKRIDLDEFVKCYNPENRHTRKPTWTEKNPDGRWRAFDYEELINRDKASLDIFWLKDESLEASDNLPEPDIIAREIVTDLQDALAQFQLIADDLGEEE